MERSYTTYSDYPNKMRDWLIRANCTFVYDETTDSLTIFVGDSEQSLTNFERFHICKYLEMIKHEFKRVSFRDKED